MNKIKWGVMGTANIAANCTIPGMLETENCELYAIAGRNADKVEMYKNKYGFIKSYVGYDSLIEDPEVQAVYIPLPNNLHKEWVIKALKAGKHVLCEKPLALNAEDAREMYRVAKENNRILMEAYAYLQTPYIDALKEEITSGNIGDLVYIDTAFLTQGYKEDFRLHKNLGGGMIYDLGCYCTTMVLTLVEAYGGDTEVEYAKASAELTEDEGIDSLAAGILKFKNGVRASFNVGCVLGVENNARYDRLYIHGTKGDIRSEVEYNQAGELSYRLIKNGSETVKTVTVKQNYSLETAQLGRSVLEGEIQRVTPEFSVKNAEIIDRLLESCGY